MALHRSFSAWRFSTRALLQRHWIWVLGLSVIAFCAALIARQNGVNYGYDGGYYMSYAQAIRAGQGLNLRIAGFGTDRLIAWIDAWPPLYPMILARGSNVFAWARLLDVFTLTASVILTYAIGYRVIRRSWAAAGAALIYLTIPTVLSEVFSTALSETVFTVFSLGIVFLMINYRFGEAPKSMRPALYAALLAAMALLTRYLGVTVVLGMILYTLLWSWSVRGSRRWLPILFFVLSLVPLGLYTLYLYGMTGSFTGQQQTDETLKFSHIPESLRQIALQLLHGGTFLGVLLGFRTNWWIVGVAVLLILLLGVIAWRNRARLSAMLNSGDALLMIYVGVYMVGFWMLGARSHWIIADWRHYIPIYPAILILVFHMLEVLPISRIAIAGATILYCVSGFAALQITIHGNYWNTDAWRNDPIITELPDLIPHGALVHGNEIGYLSLHLGIDTTIRIFGGETGFTEYQCSRLVYPPGFSTAAFTLFDSNLLRGMSTEAAKTYFTN